MVVRNAQNFSGQTYTLLEEDENQTTSQELIFEPAFSKKGLSCETVYYTRPTLESIDLAALIRPPPPYRRTIIWRNVLLMGVLHCTALYSCTLLASITTGTYLWTMLLIILSLLAVEGSSILWSEQQTYQAVGGLRFFIAICHVLAGKSDLYACCRDHRAHSKWTDTDADPYNSKRGLFFRNMVSREVRMNFTIWPLTFEGWLLVRKHPEVLHRGRSLDLGDLKADPVVAFQRTHYHQLLLLVWAVLPTSLPIHFFNERPLYAFLVCVVLRHVYVLNFAWMTSSWKHLYETVTYSRAQMRGMSLTKHSHSKNGIVLKSV